MRGGAECSQKVVGVHDDVHEAVDEADESPMAPGQIFDAAPGYDGHHGVVVQVQEGDLLLLLAQDEEHRIQQLRQLGQEVDVASSGHLHSEANKVTKDADAWLTQRIGAVRAGGLLPSLPSP